MDLCSNESHLHWLKMMGVYLYSFFFYFFLEELTMCLTCSHEVIWVVCSPQGGVHELYLSETTLSHFWMLKKHRMYNNGNWRISPEFKCQLYLWGLLPVQLSVLLQQPVSYSECFLSTLSSILWWTVSLKNIKSQSLSLPDHGEPSFKYFSQIGHIKAIYWCYSSNCSSQ